MLLDLNNRDESLLRVWQLEQLKQVFIPFEHGCDHRFIQSIIFDSLMLLLLTFFFSRLGWGNLSLRVGNKLALDGVLLVSQLFRVVFADDREHGFEKSFTFLPHLGVRMLKRSVNVESVGLVVF